MPWLQVLLGTLGEPKAESAVARLCKFGGGEGGSEASWAALDMLFLSSSLVLLESPLGKETPGNACTC